MTTAPLLSIVVIAKNEEASLPALFESLKALKPLTYEVCLHDTGSTDATITIARSHGAQVTEGEWTGDYGAARNKALAMARGTWALSLDADETITADPELLGATLHNLAAEKPTVFSARVPIEGTDFQGTPLEWLAPRLLRVGHSTWYRRVHEFPAALSSEYVEGKPLAPPALTIHNHGVADQERYEASMHRKLASLETELAELPAGAQSDVRAMVLVDLGRTAATVRPEATEQYLLDALADPRATQVRPMALEHLAQYYLDSDNWERFEEADDQLAAIPERADYAKWLRAKYLQAVGRPAEALPLLAELGRVAELRDAHSHLMPAWEVGRETLRAAAAAGDRATILAAAVGQLARFADDYALNPLLTLWGAKDPAPLAAIIRKALPDEAGAEQIGAVLRTDERGEALADLLEK